MNYDEFQEFFFELMNLNGPIEEPFWHELFQQMLNTAFEVYQKYE